MKSEHLWMKFICETCINLNKLSYQIMQKLFKLFFKSMILEDDIKIHGKKKCSILFVANENNVLLKYVEFV